MGSEMCIRDSIYVKQVRKTLETVDVHGMVHITGGGGYDYIPRIFSTDDVAALIDFDSWQRPNVFAWLQQAGNISEQEMLTTFNCGIGMLLIVSPDDVEATLDSLRSQGEAPVEIGEIVSRDHTAPAGQILIR